VFDEELPEEDEEDEEDEKEVDSICEVELEELEAGLEDVVKLELVDDVGIVDEVFVDFELRA
jgi:hypothetical protein